MYIEDNNLMFSYNAYDNDLITDQEIRRKQEYDVNHNPANHYSNVYIYDGFYKFEYTQLVYSNISQYQGFNYIPPLFYEQFEVCLWKIDELNVAKIKSQYFTPNVSH